MWVRPKGSIHTTGLRKIKRNFSPLWWSIYHKRSNIVFKYGHSYKGDVNWQFLFWQCLTHCTTGVFSQTDRHTDKRWSSIQQKIKNKNTLIPIWVVRDPLHNMTLPHDKTDRQRWCFTHLLPWDRIYSGCCCLPQSHRYTPLHPPSTDF